MLVLDQTQLPRHAVQCRLATLEDVAVAIRTMQVRGAPLIGATAAYGVALGLVDHATDAHLAHVLKVLGETRPTAVNLQWALSRLGAALSSVPVAQRREVAWQEARAIAREDSAANAAIGEFGWQAVARHRVADRPLQLMTHCNAGRLATVEHGTALSPVYFATRLGVDLHVWVSETRPRNQGLLTCWELAEAGVAHTLLADNAAGLLLRRGEVDAVIVGADRIAANGDVANKVGTYLKALAAKASGIPFYVAAPLSTIDFDCTGGDSIPIEERDSAELGVPGIKVVNPAFDVTPAELVTAIVSERGVLPPSRIGEWRTL